MQTGGVLFSSLNVLNTATAATGVILNRLETIFLYHNTAIYLTENMVF